MKKATFIILIICNSVFGQTKQDTIDWLNDKFKDGPYMIGPLGREARFLKIFNDGSFEIKCESWNKNASIVSSPNYTYKIKGNFKDLSTNGVVTRITNQNQLLIQVNCAKGECLTQINDDGTVYKSDRTLIGVTDISFDKTMEKRGKSAFIHLITLCGGKKEAF